MNVPSVGHTREGTQHHIKRGFLISMVRLDGGSFGAVDLPKIQQKLDVFDSKSMSEKVGPKTTWEDRTEGRAVQAVPVPCNREKTTQGRGEVFEPLALKKK